MARVPFASIPKPIKILYETSAEPGGWDRAVRHAEVLARRRERRAFVDFRKKKGTWVVWDWAHHASPRVIPVADVTDEHGRYGMTAVSPKGNLSTARRRLKDRSSRGSRGSRK